MTGNGPAPLGSAVTTTAPEHSTASAGATGSRPSSTPPAGWLAYTGVWVVPFLIAGLVLLAGGALLLLIARRRRENQS